MIDFRKCISKVFTQKRYEGKWEKKEKNLFLLFREKRKYDIDVLYRIIETDVND